MLSLFILRHITTFYFDNKYTKKYVAIIENALRRGSGDEGHHIIPRSMCKNLKREPRNIVMLTYREHYICHLLLVKMCITSHHRHKMVNALRIMSKNSTSRTFVYLRKKYNEKYRDPVADSERRRRISETQRGKVCIHNTKTMELRYLTKKDANRLGDMMENGWVLGLPEWAKYNKRSKHKMAWVNDGSSNLLIKSEKKHDYVNNGYHLGRLPISDETREKHRKRMSSDNPFKGKTHSLETREKFSRDRLGTFFVTNGSQNRRIGKTETIPEGWWKGLTRRNKNAPME